MKQRYQIRSGLRFPGERSQPLLCRWATEARATMLNRAVYTKRCPTTENKYQEGIARISRTSYEHRNHWPSARAPFYVHSWNGTNKSSTPIFGTLRIYTVARKYASMPFGQYVWIYYVLNARSGNICEVSWYYTFEEWQPNRPIYMFCSKIKIKQGHLGLHGGYHYHLAKQLPPPNNFKNNARKHLP